VNANVLNYGLASVTCSDIFTYYPHVSVASGRFANAAEEQEIIKSFLINESTTALSDAMLNELLTMRLQSEQITCQFKRLSEVIAEHQVTQIDLLKIDVEKSEYDVLLGIAEHDWPKIKQVVLEVHDSQGKLAAIQQLLEHHGFICTIEQEAMLKESGLYNLYAIHHTGMSRDNDTHSARLDGLFSSPAPLIHDVKKHLIEKLPDYMIPSAFVLLDALPLTPNGKVDRRALPNPEAEPRTTQIVQPSNPVEAVIAQIWSETLNQTQIGIHDKFMDLGGHSLQAMQVIAKLGSTFQVQFPLSRLFQASTVAKLAELLVEYERKPGQIAKLARLQQCLSQLTTK
jgi:acyl carrier protein